MSHEVVSPQQRLAAGKIAEPPLTDHANGFAWPDTPIGVLKNGDFYTFFGSDGGEHMRQLWNGNYYGNNKAGSATSSVGTLDNPLGSASPIDVSIDPNPDPSVNPNYSRYDYLGGGPVYRVPPGSVGAGNLLMVYTAKFLLSPRRVFILFSRWPHRPMKARTGPTSAKSSRSISPTASISMATTLATKLLSRRPTASIYKFIFAIGSRTAPRIGATALPMSRWPARL
jgi:hypothetical protein